MKLLVIEDELDLQESIELTLSAEGFSIETASDFPTAEEKIYLYEYDCIIVDLTLPGDGSGLDLIKKLKEKESNSGIIIISARDSLDDKLKGLDIGADDYLTKPFHLSELSARIKSIIRRRGLMGLNEYVFHEITIILEGRKAIVNGNELILTKKEYDLLLYFIMNKNKILSKEMIVEHLWGDEVSTMADSLDFVYTHIKNLRKKLIDKGCKDYVQTVYGIGYKFSEA
ncbi:response regulator transcription factor [Apibacter muscae]|uniref:response regulator transcription factor n=1 Tax=Apibacter muscae TaxID=2509004 RepID=UPI0011ACBAF7|nr:response regulator transcription factor [Apibacter muscae]TWP30183.1 response regulator transcription factor [Apibacter muscae]